MVIGASYTGVLNMTGYIGSIVAFREALSDGEMGLEMERLGAKYGITIT